MNVISFIVALAASIFSVVVVATDISYQLTAEEQLFAWVRSFGGRIDGITLMSPSDGPRGLFTTKDFVNQSIIMVIPPEVMIVSKMLYKHHQEKEENTNIAQPQLY